jgi:glycosyltransferase involved in cell wall biosynthesis
MSRNYSARILYGNTLDVDDWRARHAAGTVPSSWPYGLDFLGQLGVQLSHVSKDSIISLDRPLASGITFGFDERVASDVASSGTSKGCGVIWLAERPSSFKDAVKRRLAIRDLRKLDLIWCYSPALVDRLARLLRVDRSEIHFVPLGIDEEFYALRPYPESEVVLSVGNDRSRDSKTLYEAMELMHGLRPQTRFIVQSKDAYPAPSFVERVNQFSDHAELRENYAAARLVMIATHRNLYTSGSTVALEVQAMGRPVVVTRTPGMEAYVDHGTSGYLAPQGDANALANYALRILNNRDLGAEFGMAGHARVIRENTTREMTRTLDGLFARLLERKTF